MKKAALILAISVLSVLTITGAATSAYFYSQFEKRKGAEAGLNRRLDSLETKISEFKIERTKNLKAIKKLKAENSKMEEKLSTIDIEEDDTGDVVPKEASSGHASESGNLIVTRPTIDDVIKSPVVIKGKAVTFESAVNLRIKDENGKVLKQSTAMTDAPDVGKFGGFFFKVMYRKPTTKSGSIEIYEYSARDGREINKVIIPVLFAGI